MFEGNYEKKDYVLRVFKFLISWMCGLFFENAHKWELHNWHPQEPRTRCTSDEFFDDCGHSAEVVAGTGAQCSRKINFVQKIEIMIVTKQQKTGEHVENQKFYLVSD